MSLMIKPVWTCNGCGKQAEGDPEPLTETPKIVAGWIVLDRQPWINVSPVALCSEECRRRAMENDIAERLVVFRQHMEKRYGFAPSDSSTQGER